MAPSGTAAAAAAGRRAQRRPAQGRGPRLLATALRAPSPTNNAPNCPVFIDGVHATTLKGTYEELFAAFKTLVDDYVDTNYRRV